MSKKIAIFELTSVRHEPDTLFVAVANYKFSIRSDNSALWRRQCQAN